MSAEAVILARLEAIEQQNRQVLVLLAKLAGENVTLPQEADPISVSRRMEIRQMAFDLVRTTPKKKKSSRREVRA